MGFENIGLQVEGGSGEIGNMGQRHLWMIPKTGNPFKIEVFGFVLQHM